MSNMSVNSGGNGLSACQAAYTYHISYVMHAKIEDEALYSCIQTV